MFGKKKDEVLEEGTQPVTEPSPDDEYDRPRGTWADSGYDLSDEEAHRNVKYKIPNVFSQTITMFRTQMSLYSKRKFIYVILVMAILIPVIYYMTKDFMSLGSAVTTPNGTGLMGLLICLYPFMIAIVTGFLCGSSVPSEFNDRSAYMNMALPMSRTSFMLGKYLAGLVITVGIFVFAYGMSMAAALMKYQYFEEQALMNSFVLLVMSVLVYTSFSFFLGSVLKRGANILSFLLMMVVMPAVEIYLLLNENINGTTYALFPNLMSDNMVMALGSNLMASPGGTINLITSGAITTLAADADLAAMCGVSVVWSVAFLILSIIAINRREM